MAAGFVNSKKNVQSIHQVLWDFSYGTSEVNNRVSPPLPQLFIWPSFRCSWTWRTRLRPALQCITSCQGSHQQDGLQPFFSILLASSYTEKSLMFFLVILFFLLAHFFIWKLAGAVWPEETLLDFNVGKVERERERSYSWQFTISRI